MNNDRLRFRVWCEYHSNYEKDIMKIDTSGNLWHNNRPHTKGRVIEFCTGIKDCNGTLISDGDKIKGRMGRIFSVLWNEEESRWWIKNENTKEWKTGMPLYQKWIDIAKCEVVGTIHVKEIKQ